MYDYIKGTLVFISPLKITVEANNIGYLLNIPLSSYNKLPQINSPITCFVSLIVREDCHTLYGFMSQEERNLFEILITVSGIGPKTAVGIIGHLEIEHFQRAVLSSDVRLLSKVPGIGKKTAEKLIIEMRDKIKVLSKELSPTVYKLNYSQETSAVADALNALINLGYNHLQAQKAVNKALEEAKDEKDAGKLIALALKKM